MDDAQGWRSVQPVDSGLTQGYDWIMVRTFLLTLAAFLALGGTSPTLAQTSNQSLIDSGNRLAAVLRAGRNVVSNNQALINDPDVGDKGLTPEAFVDQVIAEYQARNGEPPITDGLSDLQVRLTEAQLAAMSDVVAAAQPQINAKGVGFKGFIPAVFARLTNERFGEKVGDVAVVRVTAPPELVRNRKARPDAWEKVVIETKFLSPDWQKGSAYEETVTTDNGPRFRMLIPEYYSASCLTCHGQPKGETDVTGYPKEGGAEGDLGSAISISLKP
jgi:hypothetical protein